MRPRFFCPGCGAPKLKGEVDVDHATGTGQCKDCNTFTVESLGA